MKGKELQKENLERIKNELRARGFKAEPISVGRESEVAKYYKNMLHVGSVTLKVVVILVRGDNLNATVHLPNGDFLTFYKIEDMLEAIDSVYQPADEMHAGRIKFESYVELAGTPDQENHIYVTTLVNNMPVSIRGNADYYESFQNPDAYWLELKKIFRRKLNYDGPKSPLEKYQEKIKS